jgi:hypothetical protein
MQFKRILPPQHLSKKKKLQGKSYYAYKEWYSEGSHQYVIHLLCKVKMIPSHHSVTLVNTELIYQ